MRNQRNKPFTIHNCGFFYGILLWLAVLLLACTWSTLRAPDPTPTPIPYPVGVGSVEDDLDKLPGYRAEFTVDFEGTRHSRPANGRIETTTEVVHAPPALHYTFYQTGQLPQAKIPAGVSEFYRIEERVYLKKAGETLWTQFAGPQAVPADFDFLDLQRLVVLPLTVATPPLTQTLKGMTVTHFVFTETNLLDPHILFERAQGEVWLASEGYVARYTLSGTLRITLPDSKSHLFDEGQLNLRYTLTPLREDFSIEPPVEVPTTNLLNNLPRLPDADVVSAFPDLVEYLSATPPVSATHFYQNELTAQQWVEESAAVFEEKARLVFSKDGRTLTIIITPLDNSQNIKVLLNISK